MSRDQSEHKLSIGTQGMRIASTEDPEGIKAFFNNFFNEYSAIVECEMKDCWVQGAAWDSISKELLLTTKRGRQIHIQNVDRKTFFNFTTSNSAKRFFNRHLKHNVIKGGE